MNSRTCRSTGLAALGEKLRPRARALEVAQDQALTEKRFVADLGGETAPWQPH